MANNPIQQVAATRTEPETLQSLLQKDAYKARFEQVLGERAPQFISSILSVGARMKDVEPRSIVASAAIAASLNLPIDPNLGFAWIIPYQKDGRKLAQFQLGARGVTQLAQRTGAYTGMNAEPVNAECFKGRDAIGDPIIDWNAYDESLPVAGYAFGFRMANGFTKLCYWPKKKVELHAQRYSQAYRSKKPGPWTDNFDRMAIKTVVMNELKRWGIMSVEMQGAFAADSTIRRDIDAEPEYPEAIDQIPSPTFENAEQHKNSKEAAAGVASVMAPAPPPPPVAETPRRGRGRPPKSQTVEFSPEPELPKATVEPSPNASVLPTAPASSEPPWPEDATSEPKITTSGTLFTTAELEPPSNGVLEEVQKAMAHSGITEDEVLFVMKRRQLCAPETTALAQISEPMLNELLLNWTVCAAQVRINRTKAR